MQEIRFAALSLDGVGVLSYGPCSLVLSERMISHRSSVFEENSVLFMDHMGISMASAHQLPVGYRATWPERSKLCVAKLVAKGFPSTTAPGELSQLLRAQGTTGEEDDFVEVHVWGPISIRTVDRVVVTRIKRTPSKALLGALRSKLAKFGLKLEDQ